MPTTSLRRPTALRTPPAIARKRPAARPLTDSGRLPWPLPALLCWALAWGHWLGMQSLGAGVGISFASAALISSALALLATSRWRRLPVPESRISYSRTNSAPAAMTPSSKSEALISNIPMNRLSFTGSAISPSHNLNLIDPALPALRDSPALKVFLPFLGS